MRHAEATTIAPLFRALREDQVEEKSAGEIVTTADRACERLLSTLLRDVRDLPIVGEEASAADPSLRSLIDDRAAVWVVDPLDGTSNFASGSPDYAVMVALVEAGLTTASWIWSPHRAEMSIAERGAGATCNGTPTPRLEPPAAGAGLAGVVKGRFLPPAVAAMVDEHEDEFGDVVPGTNCAGLDYPALVAGALDYIVYWRTLPWDHAPGVLLALECGAEVSRPDGTAYRPGSDVEGLLVGRPSVAAHLRTVLFGSSR